MPTISNEIMMPGTYQTYKNARPQLLSNGWIVAAVYAQSVSTLRFRVKKTPTSEWEPLAFLTTSNVLSWSLAVKGTRVFATLHTGSSSATSFLNFDATTVNPTVSLSAASIDNTSTSGQFSGEDLIINDAGTELHHTFSAKTTTYTLSFNIRHMKVTINADGSVTWGTAQFVSTINDPGFDYFAPIIILNGSNQPVVIYTFNRASSNVVWSSRFNGTSWLATNVYNGTEYDQRSSSGIFIPQSINGLTNGRLWVTWHSKDATNPSKFNIRTSFSDDGGSTWATSVKQTTGNLYDQTNPSLTADKSGKIILVWDKVENPAGTNVTVTGIKSYVGSSWSSGSSYNGDDYVNPAVLFDRTFSILMTLPPLIRYNGTNAYFSGTYNIGPIVSPDSGALGNKETPTVTSYTVTPDLGTITQIVEKLNGTTLNTYNNPASLARTLVIPQSNRNALAFWQMNTVELVITDSNGMIKTVTYTFVKKLATIAGLIETTKANADAKDRISQKRDALAAQVGLSAGSTFDEIIAQLASGAFMRVARGTFSSFTSGTLYSVNNLLFRPKIVFIHFRNGTQTYNMTITEDSFLLDDASISNYSISVFKNNDSYEAAATNLNADRSTNLSASPGNYDGRIIANGFEFRPFVNTSKVTYIALG